MATTESSTPPPTDQVLPLGGQATLTSNGNMVHITVLQVLDSAPPTAGSEPAEGNAHPFATPANLTSDDGNDVVVDVLAVADPAEPAVGELIAGTHLVAVKLSLANSGPGAYTETPTDGFSLVAAAGHRIDASFVGTKAGPGLDSGVNLAPGDTRVGYLAFEVADGAQPVKLQVQLDGGTACSVDEFALA